MIIKQALWVAVAVAPNLGLGMRLINLRIIARDTAVRVQPNDRACVGGYILAVISYSSVTNTEEEVVIVKRNAATEVTACVGVGLGD